MPDVDVARLSRSLSALLLVLIAAACSSPPASVEPSAGRSLQAATISRDGVSVTLTLEGVPQSGIVSWADALISNDGPAPVRWAGGACGDPASIRIDVRDASEPGRDWPGQLGRFKTVALGFPGQEPTVAWYVEASRVGQSVACPASMSIERLAPGAAVRMRAGWDGRINGAPAPTGPATVSASFASMGVVGPVPNDTFKTQPIAAEIRTTVEGAGGAAALSPALAIDAALADPQFADFVQSNPEATWINPDVGVIAGVWNVGLFVEVRGGGGERSGSVKVDQNGAIVGRRFDP
jgi:hypothetical protein